jgi:hypothetical protein
MSFVAVAAIGIGAASIGVGVAGQVNAANQQNAYRQRLGISQNKQYRENAEAVTQDVGLQLDQLAQRDIEQAAATRLELDNAIRGARSAASTMNVQAAAAGVEGRSVDLLQQQFARDVADFASTAGRNLMNFRAQAGMEARAIYARGQSAINQGTPNPLPPTQTVNAAVPILQGISTGIGVYGTLRSSFQAPTAPSASGRSFP